MKCSLKLKTIKDRIRFVTERHALIFVTFYEIYKDQLFEVPQSGEEHH